MNKFCSPYVKPEILFLIHSDSQKEQERNDNILPGE